MIDKSYATEQVARLEALPYFPRTEAGIGELVNALQQAARSESHAEKIVDEFTKSTCDDPRSPTPAEIIRTGWNLLETKPAAGCPTCDFTGYVHTVRTINGEDYEFSAPCGCRPAPKAPDPTPKPQRGMTKADPRMLAAGGAE